MRDDRTCLGASDRARSPTGAGSGAGPWPRSAITRRILCPLLASVLITAGCAQREAGAPGNLTITVEKGFVKRQAAYASWPRDDESLFFAPSGSSKGGMGGDWNFGKCDDPRAVIGLIAVVVALLIVAETIDVTYHNVHGLQLSVSVEGDGVHQSFPLHWGENRLSFPQSTISRLADGSAVLFLGGTGTRHVRLLLPTAGLDWEREVHTIALTDAGDLVADGRVVAMPPPWAVPGRWPLGAPGP